MNLIHCPGCGCTERDPCLVFEVPCCWVPDERGEAICSACASLHRLVVHAAGLEWLRLVVGESHDGGMPAYLPPDAAISREMATANQPNQPPRSERGRGGRGKEVRPMRTPDN